MLGSKGCSKTKTQNSKTVSIHSRPPGVLAASYAHFCSSNLCNRANSSSVLVNSLPHSGMGAQRDGVDRRHGEMGPQRHRDSGLKEGGYSWEQSYAPQPSLCSPATPAPGDLQCPACVQIGGSCTSSNNIVCPIGTTHCYNGYISLEGGEC